MRLCLALHRTRRELRATMDADEFHDWIAFHQSEPFGGDGEDARLRLQVAYLINGFSGANLSPADIKFEWGPRKPPEDKVVMISYAEGVQLLPCRVDRGRK